MMSILFLCWLGDNCHGDNRMQTGYERLCGDHTLGH